MRLACILLLLLGLPACEALPRRVPAVALAAITMADVRAGFRETLELIEAGDLQEARGRLAYLLEHDETLEDYYLYYAAVVRRRLGDEDEAQRLFARLYVEHARSVWIPRAALELGRSYLEAGQLEKAEPFLTVARHAQGAVDVSLSARLALARLAHERGESAAAATQLVEVRAAAAGSATGVAARELLYAIRADRPDLAPRGPALLDEARLLVGERDYVAAEKLLRRVDPEGASAPAQLLLADAMKGQNAPAAAASILGSLVERFPSHRAAPGALFRMATLLWNQDEDVSAEAAFREYLRRYPSGPSAADSLYALGRIQQSAGNWSKARETYAAVARRFPRAKVTPEAAWRVGWILYRSARYAEAAKVFSSLDGDGPVGTEALYWRARATERTGRRTDARRLYERVLDRDPQSYYAWQAERRLGRDAARGAYVIPPPLTPPAPPPALDRYHFGRFESLRAARLGKLARGELAAIERDATGADPLRFLAFHYVEVDDYSAAWRVARKLGGSGKLDDPLRQRLRYPLGYWTIIRAEAERYDIDPLLVVALIRQESFFDPEARSSANAQGLMQLLPSTARQEAAALGWPGDPSGRLHLPEVNLPLGVRHLRRQLDRWNGDLIKALASYNGGAPAVGKWERLFGDLDTDEFVESITFRETRAYVKRVTGHHRAYESIYRVPGAETPAPSP